jgi:enoyl-CoA hydratase/carnithine racemase
MSDVPRLTDCRIELSERIAVLHFERDDVRNALTGTALIEDIVETVRWANLSEDVSVLVLTGAGRAFSAGGNIKDMQNRGGDFAGDVAEVERRYRQGIQRIPLAIQAAELPVIAAVNGPAIGAGCDLACMCDLRIGSTSAQFGETFLNLGIIPGDGGAWFLQRLIGYQRAAEMTFTGRLINAEDARALGLLLEVTTPDALMPRALELARSVARQPPQALRYTKRLLKMAQRMELRDFLDLCATFQGICHNSCDHLEAVSAFLERREAKFLGR